jgi:hypothetical protein
LQHNLWSICDVRIWARDSSSQSSHRGCYLWMHSDFGRILSIFILILEVFWAISCWFWSFFRSIFMLSFFGAILGWFWKSFEQFLVQKERGKKSQENKTSSSKRRRTTRKLRIILTYV